MIIYFYRIFCKDKYITDCYVGSTSDFERRKKQHISKCKNENDESFCLKSYRFIRDNGDFDNWDFELLKAIDCDDKNTQYIIENEFIDKYNTTLNCDIPGRTNKKYYEDNRDEILRKKRIYYKERKDMMIQKNHKYYDANRDHLRKQHRIYYKQNKDKLNEVKKQKTVCDCGSIVRRSDLPRHKKTKKHQNYITAPV